MDSLSDLNRIRSEKNSEKKTEILQSTVVKRSSEIHSPHIDPFISEIFAKDSAL
ncbi:MAG: hypothetical protein ACKVN8_01030 [Nitrosarchaeum sp.]